MLLQASSSSSSSSSPSSSLIRYSLANCSQCSLFSINASTGQLYATGPLMADSYSIPASASDGNTVSAAVECIDQ